MFSSSSRITARRLPPVQVRFSTSMLDVIPDHFFQDTTDTDAQHTDVWLVIHILMRKKRSEIHFCRKFSPKYVLISIS